MNKLLFIVLFISGCATNPSSFDAGRQASAQGNHQLAIQHYNQCANQGYDGCINNIGSEYEAMGKTDEAKPYYYVAARYGNTTAINNLIRLHVQVPVADLAPRQQSTNNSDWSNLLTGIAILGSGAAQGYSNGTRQTLPAPSPVVNCNSYKIGDTVNTTCR